MTEEDFVDATILNVIDGLRPDMLKDIWWRTREGELIHLADMEDKHLRNSALFLMGMGYTKCTAPNKVSIAWLTVFRMEWERRIRTRETGHRHWTVKADRYRFIDGIENRDVRRLMRMYPEGEGDDD